MPPPRSILFPRFTILATPPDMSDRDSFQTPRSFADEVAPIC